jgi:hypothetical protein
VLRHQLDFPSLDVVFDELELSDDFPSLDPDEDFSPELSEPELFVVLLLRLASVE